MVKGRKIWQLEYDDEWGGEEDSKSVDFSYLDECHPDETYFTIVATKTIDPGEPIKIYYGDHTNSHLMLNYGFSIADNPFEFVNISVLGQTY